MSRDCTLLAAADAGDPDAAALFTLGVYYSDNAGSLNSWPKAVDYFASAARAGHSQASFRLGNCYAQGAFQSTPKV